MNTRRIIVSVLTASALALPANPTSVLAALGGSPANGNLTVQASVAARCNVTTTTVNFGAYDPTVGTPTDQNGAVTIQCTKGTVATIDLGNGNNLSGGTRRMISQTLGTPEFLTYGLFTDSPGGTAWGTGIAGGTTVGYTAPNASPTSLTVYGRMAAGQDVSVDSYQDIVVVTATF
jgi:spore coat protein U-like protein